MTYSNTKKDKIQTEVWKPLRDIILAGILIWIMITTTLGFYRQWTALRQASRRNSQLKSEINILESQNRILDKKIAESSESSYISRKMRDYFGIGTANDFWLRLPNLDEAEVQAETIEDTIEPNINKWWRMFTGLR